MRSKKAHSNHTPLLIGCVVVALIVGVILVLGKKSENNITSQTVFSSTLNIPLPKETLVVFSDKGFNPQRVVIKTGTGVRWVNRSSYQQISINSADHPTHEKYPGLNLGEFDKDSSVAYVFNTPGEYAYHDHYHPSFTGTIVVKK